MSMRVVGFYKKGAQVIIESDGVDNHSSFSAGGATPEQIGYVPSDSEKPVKGAASDVLSYNGSQYLLLRAGYDYEVELMVGKKPKQDIISSEYDDSIIELPKKAKVVSVKQYT